MFVILLLIFAASIFAAISIYKLVTIYSVKISAYAIDFALVFGLVAYYAYQFVVNKIENDWLTYTLGFGLALLATLAYGILILLIHHKLPKVSMVLNFIISIIGVSVAFPLALNLISSLLFALGIIKEPVTYLSLFENQTGNIILNYGIVLILALPVFLGRMRHLNQESKR